MQLNSGEWKRGEFKKFYAKMKIRIGTKDMPIDLIKGDEFEYDGTVLRYGGTELNTLQLRSAIRDGWCSQDCEDTSIPASIIPVRNRAASQSVNTDLSRVQRVSNNGMEMSNLDEETVFNVSDRRPQNSGPKVMNVSTNTARPRMMTSSDNQRRTPGGMHIDSDSEQEAVTIGRIRTPAKIKADMTTSESSKLKGRLEEISGSGFIPNGVRVTVRRDDSEGTVVGQVRHTSSGMGSSGNIEVRDTSNIRNTQRNDGPEDVVVGQVRHTSSGMGCPGGVEVRDTSNIRSESKKVVQVQQKVQPQNVVDSSKLGPKIRIARLIDPNFPADWDFSGSVKVRLDKVCKSDLSDTFIKALYAAETDQMRKKLTEVFPDKI